MTEPELYMVWLSVRGVDDEPKCVRTMVAARDRDEALRLAEAFVTANGYELDDVHSSKDASRWYGKPELGVTVCQDDD